MDSLSNRGNQSSQSIGGKREILLQKCTVKPVLRGHPREGQKWLLKTGDPLIQVYLHCILGQGT